MRKSTKRLLIIAAVLFAAGAIISVSSLAKNGFSIPSSSQRAQEISRELEISGNEELYIAVSTDDVKLSPSPDDLMHITYTETGTREYDLTQTGDKISLVLRGSGLAGGKWYEHITFNFGSDIDDTVRIQLPESFSGRISVNGSTGNVDIRGLDRIAAVDIDISTGDIELNELQAASVSINGATGAVDLRNVRLGKDLEITTSTGEVTGDSVTAGDRMIISNTTGGIELDNVTCVEARFTTTTGDIDFSFDGVYSAVIRASTGEISGKITADGSEFTVTSSTSTGSCNLPANWGSGPKSLDVSTTTGDIEIEFEK